MNYEKSYKEALDRAKKLKETCDSTAVIGWCEHIFPELKGNEDRKIRNAIYDALKYLEREHSWDFLGDVDILDAYTWLEKQNHDGKKWIYEDAYIKEREQLFQDGIDEVLENPQKYGLEKQNKQNLTWSEEDEENRKNCIFWLEQAQKYFKQDKDLIYEDKWLIKYIDWLKSIGPYNRQKPSDEQKRICREVYADILSAKGFNLATINSELKRLEEQLDNTVNNHKI